MTELRPASSDELAAMLGRHGAPLDAYRRGAARRVEDLFAEIVCGEAQLHVEGDTVIRTAHGVMVDVVFGDLILVEDHQQFTDGRVRRRSIGASLGEKTKPGEDLQQAAWRAIAEELGLAWRPALTFAEPTFKQAASESYPGTLTRYVRHHTCAQLPAEHFRPGGYVEVQADKRTVFCWRPAAGAKAAAR